MFCKVIPISELTVEPVCVSAPIDLSFNDDVTFPAKVALAELSKANAV